MNPDVHRDTIMERLQAFFQRNHAGIFCVYLYGSAARGAAHRQSDIDIAVLYAKTPPPTIDGLGLELASQLEHDLGQPVDLLVLNRAPVDLIHRVLRDGQLVCDYDSSARIRFEVQSRNAYFDLLPYLRQYRRYLGPDGMTDIELLEKKLAFIETCMRELQQLSQPAQIAFDIREERFVAHTLQIAIQAALDIASHIVSDGRLGEPRTNRELFDLLQQHHWLPPDLAATMGKMAGFRNIVVHGYQNVDTRIMRDIVENRLGDFLAFTATIKTRLHTQSD